MRSVIKNHGGKRGNVEWATNKRKCSGKCLSHLCQLSFECMDYERNAMGVKAVCFLKKLEKWASSSNPSV